MADEKSWRPVSWRAAVRQHPQMYLGLDDWGIEALHFVINHYIEGAADDEGGNLASKINVHFEPDNWITISDNGRGMPVEPYYGWIFQAHGGHLSMEQFNQIMRETDDGKRIPPEVLGNPRVRVQPIIEVTFSWLFTGETTPDRLAYFGFPVYDGAMLNILSAELWVQTHRQGGVYEIAFKDGKLNRPLSLIGESHGAGTRVRFQPELSLYSPADLGADWLAAQILEVGQKYPDVAITVSRG